MLIITKMSENRIKILALFIIHSVLINHVQCSEFQSVAEYSVQEEARMFGGIVGFIISHIDWLPIEINVIDLFTDTVRVVSGWFGSLTSTVESMSGG